MTSSHSLIRYPRFLGVVAIFFALVTWQVGDARAALKLDGALRFDGVDDYVTFGAASGLGVPQFTLEVWFNWAGGGATVRTGTGTGAYGLAAIPLVTKGMAWSDGTTSDLNYFLGIEGGKLAADFEEGSGGATPGLNHPVRGTQVITTNTWHHAAATYDGATWKLYLDGVLDGELLVSAPVRDDSVMHAGLGVALGPNGTARGAFEGLLDEARIWSYARTQAEILASKDGEITGATTGLVGCWNLNEGTGTTAGDSSGSGVLGTLRNGPVWISPDAVAPAAPTGLTAAPGNTLVTLSWAANTEDDVAGYNLYGRTSPVSTDGTPLNGTTLIKTTSYTDNTLVNGTLYDYALVAVDWSDNKSVASEVSATPDATAGAAVAFDGTDDYVTFGVASALGVTEFTVEVWFKKTGPGVRVTTGSQQGIPAVIPLVTKGRVEAEGSTVDANFFLGIHGWTGVLAADFEDTIDGTNHPFYGTTPITDSLWHHAAVTYDGSTWRMYLDGLPDGELTLASSFTPRWDSVQHAGLATAMAYSGIPAGFFEGVLDEARIWDYARSPEEILAAKPYEIPFPLTGLLGRWGLNEGSGLSTDDTSGNDVHGTLTNGPEWVAGHPFAADSTAPAAPQNLAATPGDESVSLAWTANSEADVAGYNVYRSTTSPVPTTGTPVNGGTLVTMTTYTDAGLTNDQTYIYAVTAVDFGTLESDPSNEATATPFLTYTLTVIPPSGGIVNGPGISCGVGGSDCTEDYIPDTEVTLSATPLAGYEFVSWTGDCPAGVCEMTADRSAGATFAVTPVPVSIGDASLAEGNCGSSALTFTVTLGGGGSPVGVVVSYETQDHGSATADEDYTAVSGSSLAFDPWQTEKTITVQLLGDTTFEGDETFDLRVTGATNGVVSDDTGLGTIWNDDRDLLSGEEFVAWTNAVGASACNPDLTKAGTASTWNAGASSTRALESGNGYAEFTVTADNVYWMAGLTHEDLDTSYQDIDYAVYVWGGGHAYALDETGQHWIGSYTAGTTFRVEIQGSNVLYLRDGDVMYEHATTPSYPLLLDTSLYTPGAVVSNAILFGTLVDARDIENVQWANQVLTSDGGGTNTLTKTGTASSWNAGASSTRALASGDGYAEFTVTADNVYWMAGLSNGDSDTYHLDIDYRVYIWGGGHAYALDETGYRWLGTYTAGTTFRVEIQGTDVLYKKDGVVVYRHATTPTYPLLLDTSIYTPGADVGSAVIAGTLVGDIEDVQWVNQVLTSDGGGTSTLTKTGTASTWDAGASSTRALASGDGYAEFTVTAGNVYWMAGLSNGDTDTSYQDIDYRIYIWGGGHAYALDETGQNWLGTYTAGTTFRVEIQGTDVLYRKDGIVMYRHSTTPSYPLLLDTSIYTPGADVGSAVIAGTLQ